MKNLEAGTLYRCLKNFLVITNDKGIPISAHDYDKEILWHTTYNFKNKIILTTKEIDLKSFNVPAFIEVISWQIIHDEKIMFLSLSKHELNFFEKLNEK